MKPEKVVKKDGPEKYLAIGIPEEWIDMIQKTGISMLVDLKNVNPNKFHQDICGLNKKNKLGLQNPSKEDVVAWIEKI